MKKILITGNRDYGLWPSDMQSFLIIWIILAIALSVGAMVGL